MPKRTYEDKIEYYNAKIKRLENKKSRKRRHRRLTFSTSDSEETNERNKIVNNETVSPEHSVRNLSPLPSALPNLEFNMIPATQQMPEHLQLSPPSPSVPSATSPPIIQDTINDAVESLPAADRDLDPELLQALGDTSAEIPIYGPPIHDTLAQRWLPILKKGLQTDTKEKLIKSYAVPDNCKLLKAPTLNPEISAAVADAARARDKKIQERQDQLGLAITAINRAMSLLLTGENKVQAIKILSDGCRMLTDLHYIETQMRTKLITPGLEKSFLTVILEQDRDETLFGSTLPEKIKASKAIEKQSLQIKKASTSKPSTSVASLTQPRARYQGNWTAPPRQQSSSRGGGRQTSSHHYRNQYRRIPTAPNTLMCMSAPGPAVASRRAPARL